MESWRLLGKKCVGLPERNREGEKESSRRKEWKIIIEFLCCSQKKEAEAYRGEKERDQHRVLAATMVAAVVEKMKK